MTHARRSGRIRAALLGLALAGCVPAGTFSGLGLDFTGAPSGESAAGILAKNSSKFSGTVMAPAGILAKNSSKYLVARLEQYPFASGLVVLTRPDGTYLLDGGKPVMTETDAQGRYDFDKRVVPIGQDVVVTATFPGNRLLQQYAHSVAGENRVDVDTAGTYVTAYLISRANLAGRPAGSYELSALPDLRARTAAMLDDGALPVDPDLFHMARGADLVDVYRDSFKVRAPGLTRAWEALLGPEPVLAPIRPAADQPVPATASLD